NIAIGSSLQIALFVAPVLIFLSYLFGQPMDLEFTMPEVVAVVVSVYILFQISEDGETNWIEGIQLLSVYLILWILFFYLPEPQPAAHEVFRGQMLFETLETSAGAPGNLLRLTQPPLHRFAALIYRKPLMMHGFAKRKQRSVIGFQI